MAVDVGWSSLQGPVRAENQDRAATLRLDGSVVLCVADGMGGHADGALAATLAVEAAMRSLAAGGAGVSDDLRLREAVSAASAAVAARSRGGPAAMGTTLVIGVVHDDGTGVVANVGDSRAYLVTGEGARRLTDDHSWVAEQVRAGRLTEEEALVHPFRSQITRCIMGPPVEPDLYSLTLAPAQVLLLCTDGVWEPLGAAGLRDALQAGAGSAADAATTVCEAAVAAGSMDNASAVVCRVAGEAAR